MLTIYPFWPCDLCPKVNTARTHTCSGMCPIQYQSGYVWTGSTRKVLSLYRGAPQSKSPQLACSKQWNVWNVLFFFFFNLLVPLFGSVLTKRWIHLVCLQKEGHTLRTSGSIWTLLFFAGGKRRRYPARYRDRHRPSWTGLHLPRN